jgi:hypothetical protein
MPVLAVPGLDMVSEAIPLRLLLAVLIGGAWSSPSSEAMSVILEEMMLGGP